MADPFDVLMVAAHPDDIEFGMAGTVARWVQEGKKVAYLICTNGEKGTSDRSLTPEALAVIREREQRAAAQVVGVTELQFLGLRDQEVEDTPEFRKMIVRAIRTCRPRTVATLDPYRRYIWHRDHRITGQVTLDAVFPYARDVHAYPDLIAAGLEPHKVKEMLFWGSDDINYVSDITATFNLKVAALRCHESQVREMGMKDLESWLREYCCSVARDEEFELGEAFHRIDIRR